MDRKILRSILALPAIAAAIVLLIRIAGREGTSGPGQAADPVRDAAETRAIPILPSDSEAVLAGKAARVVPSARQLRWQAVEFQGFVHFGPNTFTDREWGEGTEAPALFNPTDFDARQWVEAFRAAGMRGLVLTAKHHDGFCLWPSRFTDHSVAGSPWKGGRGDVVREAADACREAGFAFGVYLSPWDRHDPRYGDSPRYNAHFLSQLRELLTQYGDISEVWFDGACGEGPDGRRQVYDWAAYWDLIRELQPGAVISIIGPDARWIGNEAGLTRESEWSVIPVVSPGDLPAETGPGGIAGLDVQAPDLGSMARIMECAAAGGRLIWYPGQVDVSIRPGWFHHPAENGLVKSLEKLLEIYVASVGGNAQLLLNVPADRRGRIHEADAARLREMGDVLRRTFARNLAAGAAAAAEGGAGEGSPDPAVTLDGDPATAWQPADGATGAAIVYDLAAPVGFNIAEIREDIRRGQRVERFVIEAAEDGQGGWTEIATGTTVGWRRLLRFPAVTSSRVRLRILAARAAPFIGEFGLYEEPARPHGVEDD